MKDVRLAATEQVCVLVLCGLLGLALATILHGPSGRWPIHFALSGEPDRWVDRAGLGLCIALIGFAGVAAIGAAARRTGVNASRRRGLHLAQGLVIVCVGAPALLLGAPTIAGDIEPRLAPTVLCLGFAILGAFLGRVPPNALVGVRTPWSRTSRLAWDKSNRLAGRLFLLTGAAGLLASATLKPDVLMPGIIAAILVICGLSVIESWLVWRRDPNRERGL